MSENTAAAKTTTSRYTVEYILEQLEKIASNTAYLLEAIKESSNPIGAEMVGDARTIGLGNMIESREATNQKLIAFYEEMYRDLKPVAVSGKEKLAEELLKILRDPSQSAEDKTRAASILQNYMTN